MDVDALTIGGSGIDIFVGINGDAEDRSQRVGLELNEVEFGLALLSEKPAAPAPAPAPGPAPAPATLRKWTALQARAGSVEVVGIDGLTLSVEELLVNVNQASVGAPVIDFKSDTLDVKTSSAGDTITLDMDGARGALIEAAGYLTLNVFGFVQVEGNLAFTKSTESVTLA